MDSDYLEQILTDPRSRLAYETGVLSARIKGLKHALEAIQKCGSLKVIYAIAADALADAERTVNGF